MNADTLVGRTSKRASIFPTIAGPLHRGLSATFPNALWAGRTDRPKIALTFDDGPVAGDTPALLDTLDGYGIRATFFHVGNQAEANPDLVRQVASAGHQIGIHGYEHRAFPLLGKSALKRQLDHTQTVIADASGREPAAIRYVRPPYGVFLPNTLETLTAWDYRPVMWSLVPLHWTQSLEVTVGQVLASVIPGTLLVLHEGLEGPSAHVLAEAILPRLQADGYDFITVDEMWHDVMDIELAVPSH